MAANSNAPAVAAARGVDEEPGADDIVAHGQQQIARPLRVLVPLIQEDLKQGREAAERAGMPYYRAAGEKLLEAKSQFSESDIRAGKFNEWVRQSFDLGKKQAGYYMSYAESLKSPGIAIPASLSEYIRQHHNPTYNRPRSWHEPVKRIVDTETLNLKREELKRAEERAAQHKLALQLIDIGFKVLARTLHPDKGGSREAMARLNAVRERHKQYAAAELKSAEGFLSLWKRQA